MTKRGVLEIKLAVLNAIKTEGGTPTWIMYKARLSWHPTQRILGELIESGYVTKDKGEAPKNYNRKKKVLFYRLTEKGEKILEIIPLLRELM